MSLTIGAVPVSVGLGSAQVVQPGLTQNIAGGVIVADYDSGYASVGAQAKKVRVCVQADTSYPTGGYALSLANFGFSTAFLQLQVVDETDGVGEIYTGKIGGTLASPTLLLLTPRSNYMGTQAQVASATNVSTYAACIEAFGY